MDTLSDERRKFCSIDRENLIRNYMNQNDWTTTREVKKRMKMILKLSINFFATLNLQMFNETLSNSYVWLVNHHKWMLKITQSHQVLSFSGDLFHGEKLIFYLPYLIHSWQYFFTKQMALFHHWIWVFFFLHWNWFSKQTCNKWFLSLPLFFYFHDAFVMMIMILMTKSEDNDENDKLM